MDESDLTDQLLINNTHHHGDEEVEQRNQIHSHRLYDRTIYSGMCRLIFVTLPLLLFSALRLFLFVVCLLPGFTRFAWYYFIASDRVSLNYGSESVRQKVDVYPSCKQTDSQREGLPEREFNDETEEYRSNAPVIVFCTGGAWMIGYKMWGALLARALTAAGIVVVIPDMRNYPMVYIPDMVDDVDLAINWTFENIAQYGGDPTNIVVVGQSAGGHVACMAIFRNIQKKVSRKNAIAAARELTEIERERELNRLLEDEALNEGWSASELKGFAAISSPLSLGSPVLTQSFRRQGFNDNMVHKMFGFEKDMYDPSLALQNFQSVEEKKKFLKELPPIAIYQGTDDKTVPFEVAETFYEELRQVTLDENSVSFVPYIGWSHTDPILEGPMDADHRLHKDLFDNVNKWTNSPNLTWPNDHPSVNGRLCPHFMVKLGRIMNPF